MILLLLLILLFLLEDDIAMLSDDDNLGASVQSAGDNMVILEVCGAGDDGYMILVWVSCSGVFNSSLATPNRGLVASCSRV